MVNQITPAGTPPMPSAAPAAQPASPRPAPARAAVSPGRPAGNPVAAAAVVNQHLAQAQPELKLRVDSASGRTVFQVVQQGTGKVLLQVPSEEVLGMSRRVREMLNQNDAGTLVDKEG